MAWPIKLVGVVGGCAAWSQSRDSHGRRPLPARRHDDRPPAPALAARHRPPHLSPHTPCSDQVSPAGWPWVGRRLHLSFPRRREESFGSLPGPHRLPVMARPWVRAGVPGATSTRLEAGGCTSHHGIHRPPPCARDRPWTARFEETYSNLDSERGSIYIPAIYIYISDPIGCNHLIRSATQLQGTVNGVFYQLFVFGNAKNLICFWFL